MGLTNDDRKVSTFFFLLNKTGNFYLEWLEIPSGHKESRNLPVSLNAEDILVNTCWEKGIILSLVPIADYLCTACVLYQGLKRNKNICLNEFVNVTAPGKSFHDWGWGQNSMTMWWREYAIPGMTAGFPGFSSDSHILGFLPWAGHSPLQAFSLFGCQMLFMLSPSKSKIPWGYEECED